MAFVQPEREVAIAMPIWPNIGNISSEPAIFTATEAPANHMGVAVSSRAKKPGRKTFVMTKAGSPQAKAASAAETCTVSEAENEPRWNSTWMIGFGMMTKAAA